MAYATLFIATAVVRAQVVFSDGTFALSNYQSAILLDTTFDASGQFSRSQETSGGNPGSYLQTQFSFNVFNDPASQGVTVGHLLTSAVYDPSVQGAIDTIEFRLDARLFAVSGGQGVFTGILVEQGGQYYRFDYAPLSGPGGWISFATPPTDGQTIASQFNGIGFTGDPNFSATGAPLTFGFFVSTGGNNANTTASQTIGNDNLLISITPVPEPSTWILLTAAGVLLGRHCVRRRTPR